MTFEDRIKMRIYIFQMTNMTWPKNRKKAMIDDGLEDDVDDDYKRLSKP